MTDVITGISEKVTNSIVGSGLSLEFKADSILAPIAGEVNLIAENTTETSLEGMVAKVNEYFESKNPNPFETSMESFNLGNTFFVGVDAVVNDITPMAAGILSVIKDQIIPTTNSIFEVAYNAASESVDGGGVRLNIVTNGLEHPIWQNVALLSIVESYAATGNMDDTRTVGLTFPEMSTEQLIAAIGTVNASLNADVTSFLGVDSEALIQAAYKATFNVPGGVSYDYSTLFGNTLKVSLISLLLALAFSEEIPADVEGVDDLGQYRAIMRKSITAFALRLENTLKYVINTRKADRLVLSYPVAGSEFTTGAEIVVDGILFEEWLNLGGSVDAIYGSYVSDQRPYGAALLADLPSYEKSWVRYIGAKQSSMRDNFVSVFCGHLRDAIYAFGKANNITVRKEGIDMLFDRSTSLDSDNAYPFARRAVTHCLFDAGEYLAVLEGIDSIAEATPEISIEDAVEIATVEWLVDWALDQIKINR